MRDMPFVDDRATSDFRVLASALSRGPDAPEYVDAFALVHAWAGGELTETDDAGTPWLRSPSRGMHVRLRDGKLLSVTFELTANPEFDAFDDPDLLLAGLDSSTPRTDLRTVLGEPIESAYGNDWYLLDAFGAAVILTWRPNGMLQRLLLLAIDADELARLRRKAAKIVDRSAVRVEERPVSLEVWEEDGILGIVDPDRYRASLPGWDFASLSTHFEKESVAGRGAFWVAEPACTQTSSSDCCDNTSCGSTAFGAYTIEVRSTASDRRSVRESEHIVRASKGRLRAVGYSTLTMAADSTIKRLEEDPDADIPAPAGRLLLRIRQLAARAHADDDVAESIPIEIVLEPLGRRRVDVPGHLAGWPEV